MIPQPSHPYTTHPLHYGRLWRTTWGDMESQWVHHYHGDLSGPFSEVLLDTLIALAVHKRPSRLTIHGNGKWAFMAAGTMSNNWFLCQALTAISKGGCRT